MTPKPEGDKNSLDPGGAPKRPAEAAKPAATKPPEQDPALNNADSTPGTGMLPDLNDDDDPNMQPSS